ncbi:MAG: GTPase [Candidatus Pacearchaeota archaeon]
MQAEKEFHAAKDLESQLIALNKMISHAPSHKGAENLRQQLTTRRKKLETQIEKKKKVGKSTQTGIKKLDMQAVIVGKTNSGKSSLLKILTNAQPKISDNKFATKQPLIGMMPYLDTQIQIIEIPAIESEEYDKGVVYTADTVLILIENFEQLKEIENKLKTQGKKIIVFNKIDLLSSQEKRKISAQLQSKKYNFILVSCIPYYSENNVENLKDKIFESFDILRVFTKEPGKEKSKKPMIMKPHSTVSDVAEKILKGLSKKIKETRIWGPSSKFGGQIVGLNHKLKDMDVVEFKTK